MIEVSIKYLLIFRSCVLHRWLDTAVVSKVVDYGFCWGISGWAVSWGILDVHIFRCFFWAGLLLRGQSFESAALCVGVYTLAASILGVGRRRVWTWSYSIFLLKNFLAYPSVLSLNYANALYRETLRFAHFGD